MRCVGVRILLHHGPAPRQLGWYKILRIKRVTMTNDVTGLTVSHPRCFSSLHQDCDKDTGYEAWDNLTIVTKWDVVMLQPGQDK